MTLSDIGGRELVERFDLGDLPVTWLRAEDGGDVYEVDELPGALVWVGSSQPGMMLSDNGEDWHY